MNYYINILVYAKDEYVARYMAREVVHKKIEHSIKGDTYLYYVDFTEGGWKQFAQDHEITIPPVLQVGTSLFPTDDKHGLDMVNSIMGANKEKFKERMVQIRYLVENYRADQRLDGIFELAVPLKKGGLVDASTD
jgi:hypothetical protein